jgi:hypothetical protein
MNDFMLAFAAIMGLVAVFLVAWVLVLVGITSLIRWALPGRRLKMTYDDVDDERRDYLRKRHTTWTFDKNWYLAGILSDPEYTKEQDLKYRQYVEDNLKAFEKATYGDSKWVKFDPQHGNFVYYRDWHDYLREHYDGTNSINSRSKPNMTREEAIKIMNRVLGGPTDWSAKWLDAFEALGILKLEASQEGDDNKELLDHLATRYPCTYRDIGNFIASGGFKIVKE